MASKSVSQTLREAIDNAPQSRYRLAQETGVSQAQLCRFMQGNRGLSLASLDLLCKHLGLHLIHSDEPQKAR
jgi:transcriptional regulator with XRE-family HTH domain